MPRPPKGWLQVHVVGHTVRAVIEFSFNRARALQAASLLVRLEGGRMNYTKLLKVLYLADRRSLVETGTPITGDRVVNMKNGPVLRELYSLIKGSSANGEAWRAIFERVDYDLCLRSDPGRDDLSEYDMDLLVALSEEYRSWSYSKMIDLVHQLPEWREPPAGKSTPLSAQEILVGAGVSADEIEAYRAMN